MNARFASLETNMNARFASVEDRKSSIQAFEQAKALYEERAREARRLRPA